MEFFSIAVVSIMTLFALAGIADSLLFKGKYGLSTEFQKGIEMIGPLCLAIIGIIALVPEIAWVIEHTLTPMYVSMGLDPSMAVTSILAIDMGGFQLAQSVATDPRIGLWAGVVYGSMMGATIVFSIPVGLSAIHKEDVSAFSKGILYGIAAIPVGTFVGGLLLEIPAQMVLKNLIIPIVFSGLIVVCLARWPMTTTKVFAAFSSFVNLCAMLGLGLAMVKDLVLIPIANTGAFDIASIPFFNILGSTSEGIAVAGAVGLVLSGALPFVACMNKVLAKPLQHFSQKTGMTEASVTGFLLSCANNMAMFAILPNMKEREKVLNVAFSVCAAFVIGDHLAFAAANASQCIAPMMAAKVISGLVAVLMASMFTKKTDS